MSCWREDGEDELKTMLAESFVKRKIKNGRTQKERTLLQKKKKTEKLSIRKTKNLLKEVAAVLSLHPLSLVMLFPRTLSTRMRFAHKCKKFPFEVRLWFLNFFPTIISMNARVATTQALIKNCAITNFYG